MGLRLFMLIGMGVSVVLAVGCDQSPPSRPPKSDPAIPAMKQEAEDLTRQIQELQSKVRSLILSMVSDIQDKQIDAPQETAKVRETIKEVQSLRRKLQKHLAPPAQEPTA